MMKVFKRDGVFFAVVGALWVIGLLYFIFGTHRNPFRDLALLRRAEVAEASLCDSFVDEQEDSRGRVHHADVGTYRFQATDGGWFQAFTKRPVGGLEGRLRVEYLPEKPTVNRVQGDGCKTVSEWVWRKAILGCVVLVMLAFPGLALMHQGICEMRGRKHLGMLENLYR